MGVVGLPTASPTSPEPQTWPNLTVSPFGPYVVLLSLQLCAPGVQGDLRAGLITRSAQPCTGLYKKALLVTHTHS